jgi:DNA invertase Pin-like site-specific DNA recombinase
MGQAIAYYRISTAGQGRSGLDIEAQREAVHRFAEAEAIIIIAEHVEVETGKAPMSSSAGRTLREHWRKRARRNVRCWSPSSIGSAVTSTSSPA